MTELIGLDAKATQIVYFLTRLEEELAELREALVSDDRAAILDEVTDVTFFAYKIAEVYKVHALLPRYRRFKSSARRMGVKDKTVELQEAAHLIAVRDFDALSTKLLGL